MMKMLVRFQKDFSACVNVCHDFNLHIGQGDLSNTGEFAQGVQCVLGEVGHCAKVCVQQTPRDLQGVLSRLAEPLQDTQPTSSLNHPGQLQFHPAASHSSSEMCHRKRTLQLLTVGCDRNVV